MTKKEGKMKAQIETGLTMVSKEQVHDKDLLSTGLGQDGLENLGQFNHGFAKGKPISNLEKCKKDFARSRALHTSSS